MKEKNNKGRELMDYTLKALHMRARIVSFQFYFFILLQQKHTFNRNLAFTHLKNNFVC